MPVHSAPPAMRTPYLFTLHYYLFTLHYYLFTLHYYLLPQKPPSPVHALEECISRRAKRGYITTAKLSISRTRSVPYHGGIAAQKTPVSRCRDGRPRPSADLPPRSIYGAIIKPRVVATPDPRVTFGGKSHQNRWGHCKSKRLEVSLRLGHSSALTATGSHSLPNCRFATPHPRCRLHRAGIGGFVTLLRCNGALRSALCPLPQRKQGK